jgi:TNF receptor-associated factor 5
MTSRSILRSRLNPKVDLRAINYVDEIDENLICPICRCTLIDPVTTDCDHSFCQWCIDEALSHQEICPVDRLPLSSLNYFKSPKILYNQLDNLKAQCPCCEVVFRRSLLQGHVDKQCPEALVACPGEKDSQRNCKQSVKRRNVEEGCLHYETSCPDCLDVLMHSELANHQETECVEKHIHCELCDKEIIRCKQNEHDEVCINKIISCKWAEYGCDHQGRRSEQSEHLTECAFKIVGPMAEQFKKQIGTLQGEIRSLNEKNELQDRRIKFLEKSPHLTSPTSYHSQHHSYSTHDDTHQLSPYTDLTSFPTLPLPLSISPHSMEPAQEYFHSLLEGQEQRINRLATDLTDQDSKQTVMLFNETMPIKNEMAELRSNLQVTSTHVRFLMRLRLQENQRRFGGWGVGGVAGGAGVSPGSGGGSAGSNSAGAGSGGVGLGGQASPESPLANMPGRRLSDTTRDNLTRL